LKTNAIKLHRMENHPTRNHRDVCRIKHATTRLNTEINGLKHRHAHGTVSALRGKSRISKSAQNLGCVDEPNEYVTNSIKETTRDETIEKTKSYAQGIDFHFGTNQNVKGSKSHLLDSCARISYTARATWTPTSSQISLQRSNNMTPCP
jgi:hypothetical protein